MLFFFSRPTATSGNVATFKQNVAGSFVHCECANGAATRRLPGNTSTNRISEWAGVRQRRMGTITEQQQQIISAGGMAGMSNGKRLSH